MSFPVAGTLMIEPTKAKAEIDRFCEAMITIHEKSRRLKKAQSPSRQSVAHALIPPVT